MRAAERKVGAHSCARSGNCAPLVPIAKRRPWPCTQRTAGRNRRGRRQTKRLRSWARVIQQRCTRFNCGGAPAVVLRAASRHIRRPGSASLLVQASLHGPVLCVGGCVRWCDSVAPGPGGKGLLCSPASDGSRGPNHDRYIPTWHGHGMVSVQPLPEVGDDSQCLPCYRRGPQLSSRNLDIRSSSITSAAVRA